MRHTAHVSNQVVKKPSQNPTKTPILEGIGVFWGVKKFRWTNFPNFQNRTTNQPGGKFSDQPPTQPGKIMGNHRISTKQPGFFPTNQPNSTKNPSLQLVKLQIFTQARSQFFQLSKFLCTQRWFGWWWVGRRCCCWLGSNGEAKVGLYLKKCHVCIYYICRRKGIIISWFFSEEDGINKQNLKKKRKGQRPRHIFWGWFRQTSHPSGWKQPRIFFRAATN